MAAGERGAEGRPGLLHVVPGRGGAVGGQVIPLDLDQGGDARDLGSERAEVRIR